jgi:hypothetical protein
MELTQHSITYSGEGTLQLQWFPYPGIGFNWHHDDSSPRDVFQGLTISLPELGASARGYPISVPYWEGGEVAGYLEEPINLGEGQGLTEVVFHLVNFNDYINGDPVRRGSSHSWRGRLEFQDLEWQVTIDSVKDYYDVKKDAESKRGYAITHVGKLERIGHGTFTVAEANRVLEDLFFFLSFMRGFWVAPMLPVGLDSDGDGVWQSWGPHVICHWQHVDSWFPSSRPDSVSTLFSGFLKWFRNPIWNEPLRLAIQWFVDCNLTAGGGTFSSLPGAIVIEQVALEMLSWVRFVESEAIHSRKDFHSTKKFPAAEKIRLLLSKFNVPLAIPNELQSLLAQARDNNWRSGPLALTMIRNRIVHSSPESRERIRDLSNDSILEAWKLGLWYIELLLLSLFEYQGVYYNRLRRDRNVRDIEPVPWACS